MTLQKVRGAKTIPGEEIRFRDWTADRTGMSGCSAGTYTTKRATRRLDTARVFHSPSAGGKHQPGSSTPMRVTAGPIGRDRERQMSIPAIETAAYSISPIVWSLPEMLSSPSG
ncbi:MAG: hypothetical protein P8182_15710 [Deltaproteobacteria bacterium]